MTQQNAEQIAPRLHISEDMRWRFLVNALWIGLILVMLACTVSWGSAASNAFWRSENARGMIWTWLIPALIVPAMALIIAMGGLDLSAGAVAGLVATVMASTLSSETGGVGSALIFGLFLALMIGLINGVLVGATRLHGAIVTFGMMTLLNGLNLMLTEGRPIMVREVGILSSQIFPIIVIILLTILIIALVEFTPFGRRLPSEADNQAPWLQRLLFVGAPYVLSSLMAGFAGAWLLGRLRVGGPTIGLGLEVDVVLMVLLGGTAPGSGLVNIIGALVAAFLVAMAQNISILTMIPIQMVTLGKGAALLLFALLSYLYYQIVKYIRQRRKAVR